jgi:lysophospholipase L1-like esterase/pimeloyl-ACP methyl ester carboxylesterase
MKHPLIFLLILLLTNLLCHAQDGKTAWDNTINKNWPAGFVQTAVKSSADGSMQKVIFHKSKQVIAQPLIVSLHSWSADYLQEDPLAAEVVLRGWNYIHPDFRGPNNNPTACGSELVISDIEDAIRFAIENGNADRNEVHIIGGSGGGYATLLAYMKLNYPAKSFNAWVPISSLSDWYWESKGRNARYATDLEQVAMKGNQMNWEELNSRSPIKLPFPADKRKNTSLNIYAGIHDGYTGSVPISHSVLFYNKIATELFQGQKEKLVEDSTLISLLSKQLNPYADNKLTLGGRKIHLLKQSPELTLTLFEGGHEMILLQALALVPVYGERNMKKLNILTIGDSNAAVEFGWPAQLRKLLPFSTVINKSISGNTIGFDNLDQEKLNTLKNIDLYLEEAYAELGTGSYFDNIFIGLGTNDAKRVFEKRQKEVPENMVLLIAKIRQWASSHQKRVPEICIISPPPVNEQKANAEKYGGGDKRVQKFIAFFKKVSEKEKVGFLDSYSILKNGFENKTSDGIHLNEETQFRLAKIISDCNKSFK